MQYNLTLLAAERLLPGKRMPHTKSVATFFFDTDTKLSVPRLNAFFDLDDVSRSRPNHAIDAPLRLVFGSLYVSRGGNQKEWIHMTSCTLRQTHVESAVFCPSSTQSSGCRVLKLRISTTDKRPMSVSVFDMPRLARKYSNDLSLSISGSPLGSSLVENYLIGRPKLSTRVYSNDGRAAPVFSDFLEMPVDRFSVRLSILLNTKHISTPLTNWGEPTSALARYNNATLPVRDSDHFAPRLPTPAASDDALEAYLTSVGSVLKDALSAGLPFIPAATTATTSQHTPVYACHFGWLAALLLVAGTLFATGAAALALLLRAPLALDMLSYVASMTYANPRFRTPPGGTALDGVERARLLRHVRVRIGDVHGDGAGGVGEVAFVAADDVETRELERKCLYI